MQSLNTEDVCVFNLLITLHNSKLKHYASSTTVNKETVLLIEYLVKT